jgi:phosphonate transport system substrate-binding protein
LLALLCLLAAQIAHAQTDALRFGILPIGGPQESREDWAPLLADMSRGIGRTVVALSVTSYEGLLLAIQENRVDMAFLSGKLAIQAVTGSGMQVVAQVTRPDGLPGYRALLLARKDGPVNNVEEILARPDYWSIARGEVRSMSGYLIPQLQLFGPRNLLIETHFRSETINTHQNNALAVASGQADVATNNSADMERFEKSFPGEAANLKVIWQSALIPHATIVMRKGFPPNLFKKLQDFLYTYGGSAAGRGVLARLHGLAGFLPADNKALLPTLELDYQQTRNQVETGSWVTEAARRAKLARVDAEFAEQKATLSR